MPRRFALLAASAAIALAAAAGAAAAAGPASAAPAHLDSTQTCNSCIHVQNTYAFRGALDAVHQATAINSPISLWYEQASTTDAGADLLVAGEGTVIPSTIINLDGVVNQSNKNWYPYEGDSYVRFLYDPFGDGGADTFIGLNGASVALRHDNPNSIWQEWIEVPVTAAGAPNGTGPLSLGGVPNACGSPTTTVSFATGHCVLIDVGQTQNPTDPDVLTDPNDADTGSLVQQTVQFANPNQNGEFATDAVWSFRA
jgi:hypothetical protein